MLCLPTLVSCQRDEQATDASGRQGRQPADLLLLNGYVYTSNPERTIAEAVAVNDGLISAVGSSAELQSLQGPDTRVIDLAGRMMLPGLHDAHIHLLGVADPDICTLRSIPISLEELVPFVQDCIRRYELPAGEWLTVDLWHYYEGNEASERLPTLRAALDAASSEHPILMWGTDGHHGAVNSMALERAMDASGKRVGISRQSLDTVFARYRKFVGVDGEGNPNGEISEQARYLMGAPPRRDPAVRGPLLPQVGEALARAGITSAQQAAMEPGFLPYFRSFAESGKMKFRLQAALYLNPANYRDPLSGEIRLDDMMADIESFRAEFRDVPLVRAVAAKIYVDGNLDGNPASDPPTLPNGAVLKAYLQPRFRMVAPGGAIEVVGYVDTGSRLCQETRAQAEKYREAAVVEAFQAEHGFHPAQCTVSHGVLSNEESFVDRYVRRLDEAGFTIHMHVLGDRAARVAVNALAQVIEPGKGNRLRHGLAHVQLVHPDDQKRIGEMGLYLAWTYWWATQEPPYDMSVIPFISDVTGPGGLYDPDSYYMRNVYPVRSTMKFGAVPVAGSDAPVNYRYPRPFLDMAVGVSRRAPGRDPLNAAEAVDIHQMIAAYTINGARALNQEDITGSIEVGKKADLVVVDRNIVELYDKGQISDIAETAVDLTLFEGEVVYAKD